MVPLALGCIYFGFSDTDDDIYFVISGPEHVHPPVEGLLDFTDFQVLHGEAASFHWRSPAEHGQRLLRALRSQGGVDGLAQERARLEHLHVVAAMRGDDAPSAGSSIDINCGLAQSENLEVALVGLGEVQPEDLVLDCARALPLPPWAQLLVMAEDDGVHAGQPVVAIARPRGLADLACFLVALELLAEVQ